MKVTVWSILSGQLSGHLVLSVPATHTLRKVLEAYCTYKGASVSDKYVMRSRDNHILNLNKTLQQANVEDGDTLMIGLLGDEKQTFSFGSWYLVTFASFIIGFFGIGCVVWLCLQVLPRPQKFGVVIDAGSSHSEVFVFSWDGEKPLGTAEVKLVHRCFIYGGINSFASHVEDLPSYFEPCLSEAEGYVPAPKRPDTPIYLGATAGMRILRKFDCDGAQTVLMTLQQILDVNSTFKFDSKNVEVLSGSEEGISGWIAVNYLAHNLRKQGGTTASVLDVGGASLQVTSELSAPNRWQTVPIRLFNHTYKVMSKSFLCYGIGEARHRYDFFLLNPNKTKEKVIPPESLTDPCLAEGLTRQVSLEQLRAPCVLTDDSKPLLSLTSTINQSKLKRIFKNYRKQNEKEAALNGKTSKKDKKVEGSESKRYVTVRGTSHVAKCEKEMRHLFNRSLCESTFTFGDCMDAQSVPLGNGTLYAFSGLFHHLMGALGMGPGGSLDLFKGVVSAVCSMDATKLSVMYSDLEPEIVEDLCFDGMFVYTLLTAGLGINNDTFDNVVFSDETGKMEVVWPQGFMINKTSTLPDEAHLPPFSLPTLVLFLCFFSAFIISGILFLHHSLKIKRHSTSYQRCIADHIDQELQKFIQ
uniref:Ubiquitin-like domain-containing protein n=1 Tax=Scylla olivacea TaxID=85551 RepID=A0A0P4VYV9_SCYOL